mmetsp:Transcript_10377/g.38502  ORF Transcript_10377/g.38502 Transcript_10377/m.38502 type:complete len:81 (-) Transcript_10377:7050-7292(-)
MTLLAHLSPLLQLYSLERTGLLAILDVVKFRPSLSVIESTRALVSLLQLHHRHCIFTIIHSFCTFPNRIESPPPPPSPPL